MGSKFYVINRRDFLKNGSLIAVAVSTFGCAIAKANEETTISKTPLKKQFIGDCETTNDILGPFYRPGAPFSYDLTLPEFDAKKIKVIGRVYGHDCETPLEGALVEIWQADPTGAYDNVSDKFLFRATQVADKKGGYSFKTFMPGKYLNGKLYRPSHIHFRVRSKDHKELISQMYFKGDSDIPADPWASDPKAELRILESKSSPDGIDIITFNIYLAKA